ncbi:PQQ-dependent sugar dehydrogenase [Microbacterium thalassium]|uniref:Glucose/arabinose dehydrogenase n=1 Tax=Microbacterium thalassium TaxID=362649 RepID=A0A7X0FMS8_9MICO|nr:PQQ-dependent sugar dehydrogenase [Microbacterium thalassium]MBB6390372.1 glucose/arabinose dehydrogenase [Microbacterium thalassium]GLK25481.1 oxidoreductase [Microbacterium thalassium]
MTRTARATSRSFAALTAVAIALTVAGCTAEPAAPQVRASDVVVETVTTDLAAPWSVAFLSDGTPLVSERDTARILELAADGSAREVGVVAGVQNAGEAGLLGLAVDDADRLYAYSTASDGNRIQRFTLSGQPGSLALGEPETIIERMPAARNHDGGRIAFGPDGMLYVTVGDAGDRASAQDLDVLAGKILRMTPDGAVPDDNPFTGSLVYSYGHRNPQGLAWTEDGTLFAAEFGQDTWDELNIIEPGANYGWPEVEGAAGRDEFVDPVQQWNPDDASPSGMARLGDTLYIANLRGRVLRAVPIADPTTHTDWFSGEYGRLRAAEVAPDGSLWVLTNNTDGRGSPTPGDDRILRIEP